MALRNRAWADTVFTAVTLGVNGSNLDDLLVNAPTVDTLTAIRIIGDLTIEFDPTATRSDQLNVVHVGVGVTSREAFVAGVNSIPLPNAETEYPPRGWLYVATKSCMSTIDATNQATESKAAHFEFDIRSMRKIDKGVLFLVVQSILGKGGGVTVLVSGRVRALCLT